MKKIAKAFKEFNLSDWLLTAVCAVLVTICATSVIYVAGRYLFGPIDPSIVPQQGQSLWIVPSFLDESVLCLAGFDAVASLSTSAILHIVFIMALAAGMVASWKSDVYDICLAISLLRDVKPGVHYCDETDERNEQCVSLFDIEAIRFR